jgi:integrase/recombinase XerD
LRKRRGVELAEVEATTHQIMSWLGHLTLDEAELYTRAANRKKVLRGTERNRNRGNRA